MKDNLVLVYFNGCPNANRAKSLLAEAGLECTEVCQDDLKPGDPFGRYSSPTLLHGSKIIFGSETTHGAGGCSLEIPTIEEIQRRLRSSE